MNSRAPLFSEFAPVSSKEYKQKIQYDLKGDDYNKTLIWQSPDGINVKPFYHSDEIREVQAIPGMPKQWHIGEAIYILDAAQSAQTANRAIESGAEAIYFIADKIFDTVKLFENLTIGDVPFYFQLNFLDALFYGELYAFAKNFSITIKLDIINHLTVDGNWYSSLSQDHADLTTILSEEPKNITVDTRTYQNAGATIVQQLAYGLGHLNEYLNHCEQEKLEIEAITFEVAIGTNYFFEIAKLRALRKLADVLLDAFNNQETKISAKAQLKIIAHPTQRNKTIYDYNINMLRTTTECMSAVLGGADWIINLPYDALYHKTNDFGQRISRNQLIILKEESYFDAVSNPADGSYYIEELTRQLSEKALKLFKDIEKNGGLLAQLKEGTLQRKIKESAEREQLQFDQKEIILLGTNKHPNPTDRMKKNLDLYPFLKMKPRKTLIEPIIPRRLAEAMEQERLDGES